MLLIACRDDSLPDGLYDYQVTRLMTHDDTKVWQVNDLTPSLCDTAYYYQFDKVGDSIGYRQIRFNCGTNSYSDTVFISMGLPASLGLYFTDSIHWADGRDWLI